ncbi:MAG: hypothetical protein AB1547_10640 [Thermodesulfobacteriota bacterium]
MKTEPTAAISRPHLDLFPFGDVEERILAVMAGHLQTIIGLNVMIQAAEHKPEYAFSERRGQYEAGKILLRLAELENGAAFRLGVVDVDLYLPILTHIFGESQLGGSAAIVSVYRLRDASMDRFLARTAKVALHEVGHLLGIVHCIDTRCLMRFANRVEILDEIPMRFCKACSYEVARRLRYRFLDVSNDDGVAKSQAL